jgi:hypothetical protein
MVQSGKTEGRGRKLGGWEVRMLGSTEGARVRGCEAEKVEVRKKNRTVR